MAFHDICLILLNFSHYAMNLQYLDDTFSYIYRIRTDIALNNTNRTHWGPSTISILLKSVFKTKAFHWRLTISVLLCWISVSCSICTTYGQMHRKQSYSPLWELWADRTWELGNGSNSFVNAWRCVWSSARHNLDRQARQWCRQTPPGGKVKN